METILDKITGAIRERRGAEFRAFSPSKFSKAERPKPKDVLARFEQGFGVIAEIKKGSPSRGIIRSDYRPREIAAAYAVGGAAAISVITENAFFYGDPRHLEEVRETSNLPLLRKDFIVHPLQVYESYNLGADFILLIAACLENRELEELHSLAESLGMGVLTEVHTEGELERVLALNPRLIGVNNRDLTTFVVNPETSFRLKKLIRGNIPVISESGISNPEMLTRLKNAGFAGALIGEALMNAVDPGAALAELLSPMASVSGEQEVVS